MKRWIIMLLVLTMAFTLIACSKNTSETENDKTPEEPPTQGEDSAGQTEDLPNQEEEKDSPLYIFVGGQLVGSWEDGQWVSAVSEEGTCPFTMGEILAEEHYWTYDREGSSGYLMQCEFHTYNQGLGGFLDEESDTEALLDPYAVYVPETNGGMDKRVFRLPVDLTGEAAELLVPNYSFHITFGGVSPDLAVSRQLEETWFSWRKEWHPEWDSYLAIADEALANRNLTGPYVLEVEELSSGELVLVVNNDETASGYWDDGPSKGPEGGKYFNLVLYRRTDGAIETVHENIIDYDDTVTSTASISPMGAWDLNGDGQVEICLEDSRWEWGYNYVMARNEDGTWQRVLQANYGM